MSKITKVLSLLLSLLMLASALAGCMAARVDTSLSNEESSNNVAEAMSFTSETPGALDLSTYCLVRPNAASGDLVYAAATLRAHIEQYTGVKIELKSDSETETDNEILIGNTNRKEAESLYSSTKGENWAVKQVGTKVVLAAGELCDIVNATNWFVENCIGKNSQYMVVGDGYETQNATGYTVSGFKIGTTDISNNLKITYIAGDEVGFIDAAILLADNIRRLSGITPTVTTYSDSASGQILVASKTKGGSYSSVSVSADKQFAITKRNNNIVIVSTDSMGAEMGTQKIIEAMIGANGGTLDLSALVKASVYTYTYGNNLNLEYGSEYRIMSYNLERIELNADTTDSNGVSRTTKLMNNMLFYNPDVVGFQEFCEDLKGKLRTKFTNNGYTIVEPTPEKYDNTDTSCATRYSMYNNYTPIAYKTAKFDLLASGAKRIIPCKTSGNSIQGSYGWPGYTCTWAVLRDKTTGDVFAVTALHNKTGGTADDQTKKIVSLGMVKNIVDDITNEYSCPVFMVGDYNSSESYADILSFANETNNIYHSRYIAERGYASCGSHHEGETPTVSGSVIDHIFVTGSARVLRHRYGMDVKVFQASDHKPTFIDVVVGGEFNVSNSSAIFSGHGSSLYVNEADYARVENVIGDVFAKLAITEIMPAPSSFEYEYIEIKNTGNVTADLSEYYLYRFGFSNGGTHQNLASGIAQLFGLSGSNAKLVKVPLSNIIETDKTLDPGEVAVIWIQSVDSKSKSSTDFKSNWSSISGNVNVLTLKVHNGSSNLYPVGTGGTNTSTGYINSSAGKGFLADANAGMVLSLIHKDKSIKGVSTANDDIVNNLTAEYTRARHATADCSALLITNDETTNPIANKAANYYDYVDIAKFNESVQNITYSNTITNVYSTNELIPESLLVPASKENLIAIENTNTTSLNAVPFINVTVSDTASPGALLDGQFEENGKLAITEICYKPGNEKYEYVEVKNVSENLVDIKNYYVYRFGFSNGGSYKATGIKQLLGYASQNCAKLVKLSLANVTGDTILAKDEVAILWFASADSKNEEVSAFEAYWTSQGADMTNVNIIKVPVYDENGDNLYPANHSTDVVLKIHANCGSSFLPDKRAGFVISMIHKNFAATDDITPESYASNGDGQWSATSTNARHTAADSIAFVLLDPSNTTVSAHFNEYIDWSRFTAARSAEGTDTTATEYKSLMVYDSSSVTTYANSSSGSIIFPAVNQGNTATPGVITESAVVVEGVQTSTNSDNNTADLRFVASLKGSYLDYLGAGFEFTLNGQTVSVDCKHVYKTLNSNKGVISPADYDADYFFCYTLKNVSAGTYTISIRSWSHEDGAQTKIYSQTKTATFIVASDGSVEIN
ncbi:MAG: hypothetical protein E7670_06920 [Ruminococcaceae bacterium]|nr:hypothetical protein [Oscillospiraceae bacterium]